MSTIIHTLPASPVSLGGASSGADSPIADPISPPHQTTAGPNNTSPLTGEALLTPRTTSPTNSSNANPNGAASSTAFIGTGGVVRRKPARRANTAERRATHNAVERQRRETLNSRFLDLAALLPNLIAVRRPSKSAIVNSSIALIHTQRRQRALAARELRQLVAEADALRRQVNEWRAAYPHASIAGALEGPVEEPARSAEFIALLELENVPEEVMAMNEAERIAFEMRGGENGGMNGFADEDDNDYGDEELNVEPRGSQGVPTETSSTQPVRSASLHGPTGVNVPPRPPNINGVHSQPQQQHNSPVSLLPNIYLQQQLALQQQQHLHAQQQAVAAAAAAASFPANFVPTFDQISNTARFPNLGLATATPATPHTDAEQVAAWNPQFYASALGQPQHQQHQQPQQQQQWTSAFQTPPNSSQGPTGPFGQNQEVLYRPQLHRSFNGDEHLEKSGFQVHPFRSEPGPPSSFNSPVASDAGAINVSGGNGSANSGHGNPNAAPNSMMKTSTSVPNLTLSLSAGVGTPASHMMSSSHLLNLGDASANDADGGGTSVMSDLFGGAATYGGTPSAWGAGLPVGPAAHGPATGALCGGGAMSMAPIPVGGGGGGQMSYAVMSMFI
ncbi:uncharacterized protein EI90DRAFT_3017532 [Cantharellus anzutake]|uniref:uncharacterized protein n=1 Tax=Cantharellus anzutake TaxID=1750568 RepID=UPI001904805B|nr:uncharacterized protein EI90DRAFT_3017532 [Cantharellus anzutake]KAF8328665.1 hypothetical protein EI90DRAFT_3017532 [Cantharellus anzutake]